MPGIYPAKHGARKDLSNMKAMEIAYAMEAGDTNAKSLKNARPALYKPASHSNWDW